MQVDFGRLLGDLRLLVEPVGELAAYFRQTDGDLAPGDGSSACIQPRFARLEIMELDEAEPEGATDALRLARRGGQQKRQPTVEENKPFPQAQDATEPRKAPG